MLCLYDLLHIIRFHVFLFVDENSFSLFLHKKRSMNAFYKLLDLRVFLFVFCLIFLYTTLLQTLKHHAIT